MSLGEYSKCYRQNPENPMPNFLRLPRSFSALSIVGLLLTIVPLARAAPRPIVQKTAQKTVQKFAQSTPICFIERSGQSPTNLDRLCGVGSKRSKSDPNDPIDLDVDVNRDGVSDQLLELTIQNQKFLDAELQRLQANEKKDVDVTKDPAYQTYLTRTRNANIQLVARLPFSDRVRKGLAEQDRIGEELQRRFDNRTLTKQEQKEADALVAKLTQISLSYANDPSLLKVQAAQEKVYASLDRQRTRK